MDHEILLATEGLSKAFPGVQALDQVDFDLQRGEIHAILGENGAGKSTLIKILGGVYERDSGRVLLSGREVHIRNPREAQQLGIRVIHQELNLLPLLSVAENVFLGNLPATRIPGGFSRGLLNRSVQGVTERVGLAIDARTLVGRLSAGEKQLVEIAQALTTQLSVMVMDEPTAALNDAEVRKLFELLRSLTTDGIGVIYITHRISEVFQIADRVTVLRDGVKVATLPVREATQDQLVHLMVGRSLEEMYPRVRSQPGEVVLEARDLATDQGLAGINLQVRRGEIVGVYGLMGSGRSRLAAALFGDVPLTSGTIWVRGREVTLRSPSQARRLGIGYVPVDRKSEGLILPLSLRKNITLASLDKYTRGPFLDENRERAGAGHWRQLLNIRAPSLETNIGSLSGGNQQKAIVGRWLDAKAAILIVNEPTRGIDVGAKVEIYSLLDDLCRQGVGILMFSSEMPELLSIADRLLVISHGRITGEFAHGEATQEDLMRCAVA